MGLINLARQGLRSEIVRNRLTGLTSNRTRTIKKPAPQNQNWFQRAITNLPGAVASFGGWILGGIGGGIFFLLSNIAGWLRGAIGFIWNFNWNVTDREIDSLLKSMRLALVGQLGESIGNFIGFAVCGILPGVALIKFNKPLAAYVLKAVSEEAFDELMDNLRVVMRQGVNTFAAHVAYGAYKNTRKAIKSIFADPNSAQSRFGRSLFGAGFNDAVKSWGAEGSKPWSFDIAIREAIERLPDGYIETFVEEAYEGFLEGCDEGSLIFAQSIDAFFAEQRLQQNDLLGAETVLEVTPNRAIEDERLIIAGPREIVKPSLVNALTHYQLVDNRDIGQFVGEIHRESVTKSFTDGFALKINFRGLQKPPFATSLRVNYTIPRVKRSSLDWQKIKLACGGANGYLWGRYMANVQFVNQGVPRMRVYGATAGEAESRAKALIELADLEIAGITITEEKKEGKRLLYEKTMYKQPTRVYPAYCVIVNRQKVLNEENGRATLTGAYKERKFRMNLWTDSKPDNWDEIVRELTITRGLEG
jgi:hypothetical protein